MNDMTDEDLDQLLKNWRHGLNPDQQQQSRLESAALEKLERIESEPAPRLTIGASVPVPVQPRWAHIAVTVASLSLVTMVGLLAIRHDPKVPGDNIASTSTIAFTPIELKRRNHLVCEMVRLFDDGLDSIYQSGDEVSLGFSDAPGQSSETPRLVLRFVLQERTGTRDWETRHVDEVIAGKEHQFNMPYLNGGTLDYWSCLLSNDSLWLEMTIAPPRGDRMSKSTPCQMNQPVELWKDSVSGRETRLLVVCELLNPCQSDII